MIGRIEFPWEDGTEGATLEDDGTWTCAVPLAQRELLLLFNPHKDGPAAGVFGFKALAAAAAHLGGKVTKRQELPPATPGTVF